MTMVTTANDPKSPWMTGSMPKSGEIHVKQGYSYIQNWVANAALRLLTENKEANIINTFVPMRKDHD